MAPTFEDVSREKYLLLTTFTKDGKPKPTAVWGVPDGDKLLIITDDGSWKTKRINNTPRVTIEKCGVLGAPKGDPVEAVARNLPKSETRPGVRRHRQAVLEPRLVLRAAGPVARRHRQGAQRDRGTRRRRPGTRSGTEPPARPLIEHG